jgi:hypothetical protein
VLVAIIVPLARPGMTAVAVLITVQLAPTRS